jgi:protein-S-isoprenylcysteine O-methyltransferase Ste14
MVTHRRFGDYLLFGVTSVELAILIFTTPSFSITDWIYVSQHLLVLAIAASRPAPKALDQSVPSNLAVVVAYAYPYAQVIYLQWVSGYEAWPVAGLVLVTIAAVLSLISLLTLGRFFGVRPALRNLVTSGPYALVRHPMYLSYIVSDIGYNLQEWTVVTVLIVIAGWGSLFYRIHAEERVISQDPGWAAYAASVRYRLVPGIW